VKSRQIHQILNNKTSDKLTVQQMADKILRKAYKF